MRKAMILDRRVYRPGQTLFHEGDQAWAAFMIEKGSVAIVRNSSDGHEVLLATVGRGQLIGEMGLIDDEPRSATARATSLTVVQVITQQTFSRLLAHADPGIVALLKVLLRRLRATNEALSTRSDHLTELFTRAAAEEDRPPAT